MPDNTVISTDVLEGGVGRITMTRAAARNAQNHAMTYALDAAFKKLEHDNSVKVIILCGEGPHFSAGHDLKEQGAVSDHDPVGTWGGYDKHGAEGLMARETEVFLQMCLRWRSISKPTIAQVQGKAIAGGLMLAWVCDLIVASDNAMFADNTVGMGTNGVEYFAHPWEFGTRKAKELLFTSDFISAQECHKLGMINHVVPLDQLEDFTLALARRVALRPGFGLKLAKLACNQALDSQGFIMGLNAAFSLHMLAHTHNLEKYGIIVDPRGLSAPIVASLQDQIKIPISDAAKK